MKETLQILFLARCVKLALCATVKDGSQTIYLYKNKETSNGLLNKNSPEPEWK